MGLKPSKLNAPASGAAEFDGACGDYPVDPSEVVHAFSPEWVLGDSDMAELREQCAQLDSAPENVAEFSFNGQFVVGKCVKVYDGDTVHFVMRYNGAWVKRRFRMIGYNSPEIIGAEKQAAIAARDHLSKRLLGKKALLQLHDFDKWGRVLCDVYLLPAKGVTTASAVCKEHLNKEMIDLGFGVPYTGRST